MKNAIYTSETNWNRLIMIILKKIIFKKKLHALGKKYSNV